MNSNSITCLTYRIYKWWNETKQSIETASEEYLIRCCAFTLKYNWHVVFFIFRYQWKFGYGTQLLFNSIILIRITSQLSLQLTESELSSVDHCQVTLHLWQLIHCPIIYQQLQLHNYAYRKIVSTTSGCNAADT